MDFINKISKEFGVTPRVAENVIKLLGEGATVPFIARYRKEMTDTMNEETVAEVKKRLEQLDELEKRKVFVLKSIAEQEKLTPELERQITNAETLQDVEDLYLPYKPKRRTKAEIARQKGLEPLAKLIMSQNSDDVNGLAKRFISKEKEVNNEEEALKGACDIMAEWISENINGRNRIRKIYHRDGIISSTLVKGKEAEAQTYKQYFDFKEPISKAPSHRVLALFRAEEEGLLKVKLSIESDDALKVLDSIFLKNDNASTDLVQDSIDDAWKRLLEPSLETEMRALYKEKADEVAVKVFAENLRQLLLAAPLGKKRVLALDPGFRTGCKVVILNELGALIHNETIYPHPPQNEHGKAAAK
ncbi:MAG: RNA-binding transcriptional accessory protein, partial [Bacteroidales bacterium]|nr:RNA-binding transcriptional accessory protein [Bacteroidales bacterium]